MGWVGKGGVGLDGECLMAAAFVEVDVVEERLDICAVGESPLRKPLLQAFGQVIIPAPFAHAFVPHIDLLRVGCPAVLVAPSQQFLVRCVRVRAHLVCELGVGDPEQSHAAKVESGPEVSDVILWEGERSLEPDLVDHPAEVHQTPSLFVGASESRNVHDQSPLTSQPLR